MSARPNLLLLPGLVTDTRLWQPQIDQLAAGLGEIRVADLSAEETISALASAALTQAPAGALALAGLSMGGYVALEIMRQAPERIRGLALLDTSARPDTSEAIENRKKAMALAETDFPAVIAALIPRLLHPAKLNDAALVGLVTDMANKAGKSVFARQQTAIMSRPDSRADLPRITCPTLVLCGRNDVITPVEVHEEMVAAIRGARLVVIEQCGHLSSLDQPLQVSAAMQTWLLDVGQ